LKDLEQLQTLNNGEMMDKVIEDIEETVNVIAKKPKKPKKKRKRAATSGAEGDPEEGGEEVGQDPEAEAQQEVSEEEDEEQDDLSKKFDVEKLKMEKEAEIAELVAELDVHKNEINTFSGKIEQLQAKKNTDEEEQKEMAENLTVDMKSNKKKNEVINELDKLKGQDLRVLQTEVGDLN